MGGAEGTGGKSVITFLSGFRAAAEAAIRGGFFAPTITAGATRRLRVRDYRLRRWVPVELLPTMWATRSN